GVTRVGPVYTPPEHRRRGYGAAVTAACTRDALDHAEDVVLFTDLANPTSNSIYQQIGYRPSPIARWCASSTRWAVRDPPQPVGCAPWVCSAARHG
ncbi:MAG: hypothetical protein M3O94_08950, partial [Actinomycetota bacterium]|nr:hypothetical protein [Actinomycetota bacterium]